MKDDPELQLNDTWSEEKVRPSKRRRDESDDSKRLPVLLGVILVLILLGGSSTFSARGPAPTSDSHGVKVAVLEQKDRRT